MNRESHDPFEKNLETLGRATGTPDGPGDELMARCAREFRDGAHAGAGRRRRFWRSAVISTLGMAASIAGIAAFLVPWGAAPRVEAAVIIEKLHEQIAGDALLVVDLVDVQTDGVRVDGHFQLAPNAIYGDLFVNLEDEEGPLEVDATLSISDEGGWVLVRNITMPDPQLAAMLGFFFQPGRETLVILPSDVAGEHAGVHVDIQDSVKELASSEIRAILDAIRASADEFGATVIERDDGTIELSLPIASEDILRKLKDLHGTVGAPAGNDNVSVKVDLGIDSDGSSIKADFHHHGGKKASKDEGGHHADHAHDGHHAHGMEHIHNVTAHAAHDAATDASALIGSTIGVVYDPAAEMVRQLRITDFGERRGTISISLEDGMVDPTLLDMTRVRTPATSVLDLDQLVKAFGH